MAIGRVLQTNFTSGVLDPKLAAREDITFYYNGLKDAKNLLVMPQGGAYARPGKQFVSKLPRLLDVVSLSGATVTAPNGGTAANVHDGNAATELTTGNLSTTNPFVIVHIDFGAAQAIDAVDLIDYHLSNLVLSNEFFVQSSTDNAAWSNYGPAFDWDSAKRSRRRRAGTRTARYWRVVRIGVTDIAAAASIGEIQFRVQNATLSNIRLVPFAYSTDEAYMLAMTGGNADIYTGPTMQGSIAIAHTSAQLPTINWTQSLDTLILFHKNVRPPLISRQGADDEFDFRYVPFTNIPQYDYGAGVGGVNEVQVLQNGGSIAGDNSFTILLEGKRTGTLLIASGGSLATLATQIQTELRALENTSATGITVSAAVTSPFDITVNFGGEDGKQPWDEMSVSALAGNAVWSVQRDVEGQYPGEDIMSDARGWPRCGLFNGRRLHLGGIPGVPDAHIMSTISDYYDLDINRDDDTKALMFRAETDQVSAIYNIVAGRHLTLFTSDAEFYYPSEAIKDDSALRLTTRCGSKEGMRVHEIDGALLFVQGIKGDNDDRERGTSAREFIYEDTRQSYDSNQVSKLSSHLLRNPVDNALRKGLSLDEDFDIELYINEDGTGVAYTVLRSDSVNALMPISTRDGDKLLAVGVDKKQRVYFATERMIGGVPERFLEMWNPDLLLDCGGIKTMTAESITAADDGQDEFTWTFENPGSADAIGVRLNGGRLEETDYDVDLGDKTIVLSEAIAATIVEGDVIRIASMQDEVTGLEHLEGETLLTVIDGTQGESFVVEGGKIELGEYADTEIQYGFDFEVSGKLMPLRVPEGETLAGEKVRVVNALFTLHETGGIEIRANEGKWQEIPLIQTDADVLDRSTQDLLFTGIAPARGLLGNRVGAPLEFRRPGPCRFMVLGVIREVSL